MSEEINILSGVEEPNGDTSAMYIPSIQAVVTTAEPDRSRPVVEATSLNKGIAEWGDDNLEPQNIIDAIQDNDLLSAVFDKKARVVYGNGPIYGQLEILETPSGIKRTMKPIIVPEIERWMKETAFLRYIEEATLDKFTFNNVFAEIIKGKYNDRVHKLYCTDASDCRLGLQDTQGRIKKVHVNANWDSLDAKKTIVVDALDPYTDIGKQMSEMPKSKKFMLPLRSQRMGEKYYAKDVLYGLRKSGWLKVAKSVPLWKSSVMDNQLHIKYHIEVDTAWWEWKYPGFSGFEAKKKAKLMRKEIETFINIMKGTGNAGNVLMTNFHRDKYKGTEYSTWKITNIDNSKFEGVDDNLSYANAADLRSVRAAGMHPTLFGASMGKGSAGSGSDIRVANNQVLLETKLDQDIIMSPMLAISEINGWNERHGGTYKQLVWGFESFYIARLDSGNEISEKPEAQTSNAKE